MANMDTIQKLNARHRAFISLALVFGGPGICVASINALPVHILDSGWGIILGLGGMLAVGMGTVQAWLALRCAKGKDTVVRVTAIGAMLLAGGLLAAFFISYLLQAGQG